MTISIRDTILSGNLGDGWASENAAAHAFATRLRAAYEAEFGAGTDIRIDVLENTSGCGRPATIEETDLDIAYDPDLQIRLDATRFNAWEAFCANAPAGLLSKTITMTPEQTAIYDGGHASDADELMRELRARARAMSSEGGATVEIHTADGIVADVIAPEG